MAMTQKSETGSLAGVEKSNTFTTFKAGSIPISSAFKNGHTIIGKK